MPRRSPARGSTRVLGLIEGHADVALSGIGRRIFDALGRYATVVDVLDYGPRGMQRAALAGATFRPDRAAWRGRFHTGPLAHRVLTRNLAVRTRGLVGRFDVALQIHGWTQGQPRPYTLYVDQTRLMADRGWPAWLPLPDRERERVLDRERMMYLDAARIFVMGAPAEASLVGDYGIDPAAISIVGGGLNFDTLPSQGSPSLDPVILFIGREFERKGGRSLLEALEAVRAEMQETTLHVVGTRRRIDQEGVVVHGQLSDRQALIDLYRRARVFCMPSLYEPWGFVFTEAMALGIPCVGTEVQSIPHLLGDGDAGLLVPPGDSARLADALLRLLTDDDLAMAFSRKGRERVEKEFTWDRVARRMAPLLQEASSPSAMTKFDR